MFIPPKQDGKSAASPFEIKTWWGNGGEMGSAAEAGGGRQADRQTDGQTAREMDEIVGVASWG